MCSTGSNISLDTGSGLTIDRVSPGWTTPSKPTKLNWTKAVWLERIPATHPTKYALYTTDGTSKYFLKMDSSKVSSYLGGPITSATQQFAVEQTANYFSLFVMQGNAKTYLSLCNSPRVSTSVQGICEQFAYSHAKQPGAKAMCIHCAACPIHTVVSMQSCIIAIVFYTVSFYH